MIRLLFLLHRYLGIGTGLFMVMWCLSGFVMLYVSYPALSEQTRLAHLAPLAWTGCCRIPVEVLSDSERVSNFHVEMLAGRPVLHAQVGEGSNRMIDLFTGSMLGPITPQEATLITTSYGRAQRPRLQALIELDQWTFEGVSAAERPLYRFRMDDSDETEVYVSRTTGRAVQLTTRLERFWNWLGSVPHWLYFTTLRAHAQLWSQIVIYVSLLGCFLAILGIYIGSRQLLYRPRGRWSPYRGFNLWHHVCGLVFGLFALTWVLSGLLSMNPWGLLVGSEAGEEHARLNGDQPTGAQVKATLRSLAAAPPEGVVSIRSASLGGRLYVVATHADGKRQRLDAVGEDAPLTAKQLGFITTALRAATGSKVPSGLPLAPPQWLSNGDNYYFSHHSGSAQLPVYRLAPVRGPGARYYIDTLSGELLAKVDGGDRGYRWWHRALHRLDFAGFIRHRPLWDILMWLLLSGVTAVCVTGAYLGCQRLCARPDASRGKNGATRAPSGSNTALG